MRAVAWASSVAVLLAAQVSGPQLRGEDFRVETDIYLEQETQPAAETLTLFFGDVVYDFLLSDPREVTVFDVRRGRIVLLDPARKIKTTMTTDELLEFTAAIKTRTGSQGPRGLFDTHFETGTDVETGELVLAGPNLAYRAKGSPHQKTSEAQRFYAFADWYARLNAARPGNPPPFARLELNRKMLERNELPAEITRTLTLPGRFRAERRTVRSRHTYTWLLSTTDRKRIEEAGTSMANFQSVSLAEYWRLTSAAPANP